MGRATAGGVSLPQANLVQGRYSVAQGSARFRLLVASVSAAAFLLALPTLAAATTVVNGNFETGDLEGWTVVDEPQPPTGTWFAYRAEEGFPPPPQGEFAAITDQGDPGAHFLYQDVPIVAGEPYLTMTVYYDSDGPITVPSPDSFEAGMAGDGNQQYRIDVMKPTAPLESLDPADILATVFRTVDGDPPSRAPRTVGVDLSALVGQTVRLRLAEVDNLGPLHAGVDSVATGPLPPAPTPPAPAPAPSNAFTFGKLTLNKKKGTARLKVTVPGAGQIVAVDAKKKGPKRIRRTSFTATADGVAVLPLKATKAGKQTLQAKGKLKFKLRVTFTPTGGTAATQVFSGRLKLNLPPPR